MVVNDTNYQLLDDVATATESCQQLVKMACEDGNSKLVEVVTVVEVDDEKHVDNSLVQIWKVNFGHKVKFLFGL